MGALVEFEDMTGIKVQSFRSGLSASDAVKLLWAMLREDQPSLTLKNVTKLVDDNVDDVTYIINTVTEAINMAVGNKQKGKSPNVQLPTAE
jgi:hypothetical protein